MQALFIVFKQGQLLLRAILLHKVAVETGIAHRVNDLVSLFFGEEEMLLGKVDFVAKVLIKILLCFLEPCRRQALYSKACLGLIRRDGRWLPV